MSELGRYKTISSVSQGFYREKGSKFIAHAIPCTDEEKAKAHIQRLRKENSGACHVCFAWRFGAMKFQERFSDDGEPNNSAGRPIFGQIQAFDLTNVLIAVVRFYGGTNLGVGGLIQAYKTASEEALQKAEIKTKWVCAHYELRFDIQKTGTAMQLLNQLEASILAHGFENNLSTITFTISIAQKEKVVKALEAHPALQLNYLKTEE